MGPRLPVLCKDKNKTVFFLYYLLYVDFFFFDFFFSPWVATANKANNKVRSLCFLNFTKVLRVD